jgi:hypothetical protein
MLIHLLLAAPDLRPKVKVEGRASEISVSPADLWVGTGMGRTLAEADVPVRKMNPPDTFLSDHLDRFSFLRRAARHPLQLHRGAPGSDFLTDDRGAPLKPVAIPVAQLWFYDAHISRAGNRTAERARRTRPPNSS